MSHRNVKEREGVSVAVVLSLVVHVGLSIVIAIWFDLDGLDTRPPEQAEPEAPEELKVKVVSDPQPDRRAEKPPTKVRREEAKAELREPKKETQQEQEEKEKLRELNRKAVVQETNEDRPEEADYVSEKANKTEEETRARETTDKFVESSQSADKQKESADEPTDNKKVDEQKLGSRKFASRQQPRRRPPESVKQPPKPPEKAEPADEKAEPEAKEKRTDRTTDKKKTDRPGPEPAPTERESSERAKIPRRSDGEPTKPRKLPMPTIEDYNRIADADGDARAERQHRQKGAGSDMFRRIEESKGSVKAALENYISEVKPGNHTSVNAHADAASGYINRIHHKIHPRWGGNFLPRLDARYGPSHPLSNPNLRATLELVIDGGSGKLDTVNIVESSGQTVYDIEEIGRAHV